MIDNVYRWLEGRGAFIPIPFPRWGFFWFEPTATRNRTEATASAWAKIPHELFAVIGVRHSEIYATLFTINAELVTVGIYQAI